MDSNGFVTITSSGQGEQFVEAYGLLLTSVLLGNNGKPPGVIAITGMQSGDGASTTALNLAMMMARTGRPTLLIDGNMRHPALHKAFTEFGVEQAPGLAEVLAGQVELQQAVRSLGESKLALLPAGEQGVSPQVLLSQSDGLKKLFQTVREQYHLVVVDTPPVRQYPDTLHVANIVDGVLLVVSSEGSSRREQQETRRLLDRVEARILGTVLNRVRGRDRSPATRSSI